MIHLFRVSRGLPRIERLCEIPLVRVGQLDLVEPALGGDGDGAHLGRGGGSPGGGWQGLHGQGRGSVLARSLGDSAVTGGVTPFLG